MTSSGALAGLSACECPVCFHTLSEDANLPMSMPCGHTLCSSCINLLVSKATSTSSQLGSRGVPTFQCPLCRDWVNRDAVHLNVTLRDLLVELSRIDRGGASRQWMPAQHVEHADIQFGSPIDRGAYGEVFRGTWQGNDVAVKVFSSGLLTPEGMASFKREVFVMNCLRHPNVVLLLGACQTPPKLSIIMEYVAGGSLHKVVHIDKIQLSPPETAAIGLGICRGLQYLHSINIMHRDLKSKNVLLTAPPPSGTAKLCDFGLARMRMESATMTGNVGTVHWSAPEVLSNQRYKFAADVYGLGMVLYEMETGRVPFQDMLPVAVMMAVALQRQQPEMPTSANPKLVEIIKSCIEWEADARCSVSDVISRLTELIPRPEVVKQPLQHQDSLGVVFVSVSDSTDLANENLVDVAKELGLFDHTQYQQQDEEGGAVGVVNDPDFTLAQQIYESEQEAMLERDRELAEQLQMKENSYRTPSDEVPVVTTPPQQVLDSIKMVNKTQPHVHSDSKAPPTMKMTQPIQLNKPKKKSISPNRTKNAFIPRAPPRAPLSHNISTPPAPPPPPPTPHPPLVSSHPPAPPYPPLSRSVSSQPPAPPPPPPVVKKAPIQRSFSQMANKRRLLEQVRVSGKKMASKLRSVQTIEKRAFRVGHVLDGYSSETAQYTVQNQVKCFNRRLLHHVDIVEPKPAFPVGRVLAPKRGDKVKRVSKVFQQSTEKPRPTSKQTTPTKKLHPSIQSAIKSFPHDAFNLVETKVKLALPTAEDIKREKAEMIEALRSEQVPSDDEPHGFW